MSNWLALVVGNTRLHWALFEQDIFLRAWHTPHLTISQAPDQIESVRLAVDRQSSLETVLALNTVQINQLSGIWIASVVPEQSSFWQSVPNVHWVIRDRVPIQDAYPSLGIDRLMTLWGAGITYGWPTLVIDAGTALTFTAGLDSQFIGGAILPGLQLQLTALTQQTAALPNVTLPEKAPQRWANSTVEAMQSGIFYTALATIRDYCYHWQQQHPTSTLLLTGGDGAKLYPFLQTSSSRETISVLNDRTPVMGTGVQYDPSLMFWGIRAYRALTQ